MSGRPIGGRLSPGAPYRAAMKTTSNAAPRVATIDPTTHPSAGRVPAPRRGLAAVATGSLLALAIAACSPGGAGTPLPINSIVPNVNPSALASAAAGAASAAAGAAMTALDQVDAAITANTSASGLSTDEAASLTSLTAGLRTALQSGDTTAAKTAADNLSTKVTALASKLNTPTGQQLTAAIAALKAALPTS